MFDLLVFADRMNSTKIFIRNMIDLSVTLVNKTAKDKVKMKDYMNMRKFYEILIDSIRVTARTIMDIYVNNVNFGEVEDCFFITSFYHGEGAGYATDIHNVYVENVTCGRARNAGIVIQGFPSKPVTDIFFKNVTIDSTKVGLSLTNTDRIIMSNVNIGGVINAMPSYAK